MIAGRPDSLDARERPRHVVSRWHDAPTTALVVVVLLVAGLVSVATLDLVQRRDFGRQVQGNSQRIDRLEQQLCSMGVEPVQARVSCAARRSTATIPTSVPRPSAPAVQRTPRAAESPRTGAVAPAITSPPARPAATGMASPRPPATHPPTATVTATPPATHLACLPPPIGRCLG